PRCQARSPALRLPASTWQSPYPTPPAGQPQLLPAYYSVAARWLECAQSNRGLTWRQRARPAVPTPSRTAATDPSPAFATQSARRPAAALPEIDPAEPRPH